ncbi:MAG TPA: hypothetical protein VK196_22315 [Magnetospirillum sp.]|nr:hypothetical protein [Magnetospirillum sp.]
MTKTQHISKLILEATARTGNIRQAIIEVCGRAAYDQMIDDLYTELRGSK